MRDRSLILAAALLAAGLAPAAAPAQQAPPDTLALAIRTFLADSVEASVGLFTAAVRQRTADPQRHAWLAEAARRTGRWDLAATEARRALQLDSCSAFGHEVVSELYNPQFSGPDTTDADSSWAHALAATRCDRRAGAAWMALWIGALERADTALERRSLAALVETAFITVPYQTHGRWVLESAPPRAVLIANGDLDTYPPLAMQSAAGVRPDVVVINTPMLELPWYAALLRTRHGLPLPPEESADTLTRGQRILGFWRDLAARGELGRPFAFLISSREPDVGRLEGPLWVVDAAARSGAADHDRVAETLRRADRLAWTGPAVSALDRSPVRNAHTQHPAIWVAYVALWDGEALVRAGDFKRARDRFRWAERFLQRARVPEAEADEALGPYREWMKRNPA